MDQTSSLTTVDNDASFLGILEKHLGADPRLEIVCADGDAFLPSLKDAHFDFIFADTWAGKYRLLEQALQLLSMGGIYIIDDMLPQANWPDGYASKVEDLITQLVSDLRFHVTQLSWASVIILATRR